MLAHHVYAHAPYVHTVHAPAYLHGYPVIHHPYDGHIMTSDEIDFYFNTDPRDMTLEQLGFFDKIKKAATKVKNGAVTAFNKGKTFWNKNKYNIAKGVHVADDVAGAVDKFAQAGGSKICGKYSAQCLKGAASAHSGLDKAAAAADKYIKMMMLQARYEAEQDAAMKMIY